MTHQRTIGLVRGGGFGFLAGAILFQVSGQWLAFTAIPLGAALGLAAGVLFGRGAAARPVVAGRAPSRLSTFLRRTILHPRLVIRFASLLTLGAVLFTLAWIVGYSLLPERALAEDLPAAGGLVDPAASVTEEWLKIAGYNLGIGAFLIVLLNALLRFGGVPLGYLPPLYNAVLYGLVLGTNSFAIPLSERMAPSLAVLSRAGPYEFAGFFLITAATFNLARFELNSLSQTKFERAPGSLAAAMDRKAWFGLVLGVCLVALAAWREAVMILAR